MLIYDVNIFLFRHSGHAVVLKTEICVTLVLLANFNEWCSYILIRQWLRGTCRLMLLYHGGLGKEMTSSALASSTLMTEAFWGLSLAVAWHGPKMEGFTTDIAHRFCLHGWPLLLNHKHLLALSDDLMFALLSAEVLLVNLMQRVSLVLEPEMWWKLQLQHEKLDNQGGGDNRPGTNHASFWEKSVHCMQEGKKPGANELS